MQFANNHLQHSTSIQQYYQANAVTTAAFSAASSLPGGQGVSLAADGSVQSGAGTSIYLDIVEIDATCPQFLSMDAVYADTYLISFADKDTKKSFLQVITVNAKTPNKGTHQKTEYINYNMYQIVSMNMADGTFIGICQDSNSTAETAFLVAGKVDKTTFAITLVPSTTTYVNQFAITPAITSLSSTQFAIGYYSDTAPLQLATRYGML